MAFCRPPSFFGKVDETRKCVFAYLLPRHTAMFILGQQDKPICFVAQQIAYDVLFVLSLKLLKYHNGFLTAT